MSSTSGWSIGDTFRYRSPTTPWQTFQQSLRFRINAETATTPGLAASNRTQTGATLTITNHTADWYYKYTTPTTPAGTCSSVVAAGTTTATVTGLTKGTEYTFKAYSDNQCTAAYELTTGRHRRGVFHAGPAGHVGHGDHGHAEHRQSQRRLVGTSDRAARRARQVAAGTTSDNLTGLTANTEYNL